MTSDNAVSGPPLAGTFPRPQRPARESEESFLREEGRQARAAVADTLEDLKASLRTAADVRVWTRRHPWAATGVAAATGFAAAVAVTPRPDQSWRDKLADLEAVMARRASEDAPPSPPPSASPSGHPGVLQSVLSGMFELAATAAQQWIMGAVQGATEAQPVDDAASDGQPGDHVGNSATQP